MNLRTTSHPARRRRISRTVVSAALLTTLLLVGTACASDDDATTTNSDSSIVPSTAGPVSTASPTTATPTTDETATPDKTTTPAPTTVPAQNDEHQAELAGILASHLGAGEFVGARIALSDADGNITETTAGTTTSDPASAPVDLDTAWNIGSVTKTFVAVVALQLADEGRIDLDAGIDTYLPDLADAATITPRQLLAHTSGLNEYLDKPEVQGDSARVWTTPELIAVAEAGGRLGEPGSSYHYSNTNFIILGEIIERLAGTTWDEQVRARIVEPLGLTNTELIAASPPVGYQLIDGALVETTSSTDPSVGGAAGALQSTGRDLLAFAAGLFGGELLGPDMLATMQTFAPGDASLSELGVTHSYGLGLERYEVAGISVVGHMGVGAAQSAFLGYDAVHGTTVAVTTNAAIGGPQAFMAIEALTAASDWQQS